MSKILIVVDMQNDFIDGALGTPEAQAIVPNVVEKIKSVTGTNTLVYFTQDTHFTNYLKTQEGKNLPVEHCIYETEGWCLNKDIAAAGTTTGLMLANDDLAENGRITKHIFGSYELIESIDNVFNQDFDVKEIELVGVCTDICVVSNALLLKNAFPETLITVDASCCAGVTPEKHDAALEVMKSCQINVIGE